jgi:hypothetical protein
MLMPFFDITEKRPRINIFKLGGAYYFKYFFDDSELFRELEPFYEKARYRFKMATVGERNKVMKDMVWVEQAVAIGAVVKLSLRD